MSPACRLLLALVVVSSPVPARASAMSTDRPTVAPTTDVMDKERFQLELGPVFGGATAPVVLAARFGLADGIELRAATDIVTLGVASLRGPTHAQGGLKLRAARSNDATLAVLLHFDFDTIRQAVGWDVGLVVGLDLPSDVKAWGYLSMATRAFLSLATPAIAGSIGFGHDLLSKQNIGGFVEFSFAWAAPNGALTPSAMLGLTWAATRDVQLDAWVMPAFMSGARILGVTGGVGVALRL